jgi:hypothetical protein
MKRRLSDHDFQEAAKILGTGVAEIKTVTTVESKGEGFLHNGRVVIRFEPHKFHKFTGGRFGQSHPQLSYPSFRPGYPKSKKHSCDLYDEAKKLNTYAARLSTSYGLFQIMGFNFGKCGCKSLTEFVARMRKSEKEQLKLFCNFLINEGLVEQLRRHDWAGFAKAYNGQDYRTNQYDTKLGMTFASYNSSR